LFGRSGFLTIVRELVRRKPPISRKADRLNSRWDPYFSRRDVVERESHRFIAKAAMPA
jgi:hypothetical protein